MRPRSLNGESSSNSLSSIILDGRNAVSVDASGKSDRYIYQFVRQKLHRETNEEVDSPGPRVNNLDCALRSGDCVVSHLTFVLMCTKQSILNLPYKIFVLFKFPFRSLMMHLKVMKYSKLT